MEPSGPWERRPAEGNIWTEQARPKAAREAREAFPAADRRGQRHAPAPNGPRPSPNRDVDHACEVIRPSSNLPEAPGDVQLAAT